MHVELTSEQAELLAEFLENEQADLRMEIAHTDQAQFKEDLRRRKEIMAPVLLALREQTGVKT